MLSLLPEVADALAGGRPVVALESTIVSHGLPRPDNLRVARQIEQAVRRAGAVPATVAVVEGRAMVGLDDDSLARIASGDDVVKASTRDLAVLVARGATGATTVAATSHLAALAGIGVFATGGIGGVHRGAVAGTFDISSDLQEMGRTAMAVVCAGPKAILDVPATLEYLETQGVPVLTVGQDELPGFYARSSGIRSPFAAADLRAASTIVAAHLGLGLGSGVLVCVPVPAEAALADDVARAAVERAVAEAESSGVDGPALTPWLLARIADLTAGASVRANTALIVNDARVAGRLAVRLQG